MASLKTKLFRLFTSSSGGGGGLPNTLTQVEYIQAYGLAYIDTGITSSANTKIEIECSAVDNISPSNQHSRVLLTAGSSASAMVAVYPNVSGNEINIRFGSSWIPSSAVVNTYEKMKLTFDNSSFTVEQNGVSTTDTYTAGTINPGTIYLFKISYNSAYWATGRVYSMKIWDGNTLVRDYVPCYRKTTKELGFYDFVSATFFGNAGVGSFHAKYLDFPTGYTQCEYIDSSAEQYFDTGVKFGSKHRLDMNFQFLPSASGIVQACFGAWDGTNNTYVGKGGAQTWRLYYAHGSGTNQKYFEYTEATFYTLRAVCADRTQAFYVNADNVVSTKNTYTNGINAYMFARHNNSSTTGDAVAIMAKIRMYNANIDYNGSRYRSYVPCYRNSDNVAGMYELNNGVFYPSATGTNFVKGSDM